MAKSSIEDLKALARAEKHSNQLDRDGSQEAKPEMGSGVPKHKAGASQVNRGEDFDRPKGKLTGVQRKAHKYTERSENGNAETTGGGNGAE